MNNENIMVSICCLAYNHEKYIRKCLDGFVRQKTDFCFEVLIHDDASTDGTADIIREYEAKYPDIIKPIYQVENQYSKGVKISWKYQFPRAKGKYISFCEGDDYWCDEYKLQKQFNALEETGAVFCSHYVRCISDDDKPLEKVYPLQEIQGGYIDRDGFMHHLFDNVFPCFFTSSYFFLKSALIGSDCIRPSFMENAKVGDFPLLLALTLKGDMFFIKKEMSCYRLFSNDSWTSKTINDRKNVIDLYQSNIEVLQAYKQEINEKYYDLVDRKILEYEFYIDELSKNYFKVISKKYSYFNKQMGIKDKIILFFNMYFPRVYRSLLSFRNR